MVLKKRKIGKNKKPEFLIVGLGRFGQSIAQTLRDQGYVAVGIDRDPDIVQRGLEFCTQTIALDSTNEEALRTLDIASFDAVIVAIGENFEGNLMTTVALKALGAKHVISKARTDRQEKILISIGADRVVLPESEAGRRLALEIISPNLLDHLPLGREHSVLEISVPASLAGLSLAEIDFRKRFGMYVVAVRQGDDIVVLPSGDYRLQSTDVLVSIGVKDSIKGLINLD
ncbi:MAG: TrkA family potassium uptake protein [Anaerolineales bacterium]|nr:TrkA family potassium uptake protein [Anaerolineales bacterium]